MAEESPESWVGKRVKVYLFNAGVPDVEDVTTHLRWIDKLGVTVDGIPGGRLSFYPWSSVRQIDYELRQEGREVGETGAPILRRSPPQI